VLGPLPHLEFAPAIPRQWNRQSQITSGTFRTATPKADVADQKCEKAPSNGRCGGVAVRKGDKDTEGCEADEFEERAAILEFDGGLSREEAEAIARAELR
jgi:hypothetical protein